MKTHVEILTAQHWIVLLMPKTYYLHASCVGKEHQCKTSGQHTSPTGLPQKKHQNIFNSRTWICVGEHPLPPWGQTGESLLFSKQSCGFPLHPMLSHSKGHETEHSQLTYEEMMLWTAIPQAPLSSSPRTLAEQGSAWFLPSLCTEGGDQFQELEGAAAWQRQVPSSDGFSLTKGSTQLAPPSDLLKSVDSDSSSTQEGPGRSYVVLKETSYTPTAIFSLAS